MDGGFKVKEMWNDTDDRFRKVDAIAVVVNRIRIYMIIFNIIMVIIAIIVAVIAIVFGGSS